MEYTGYTQNQFAEVDVPRVSIRDEAALRKISAEMIARYLSAVGWRLIHRTGDGKGAVYEQPEGEERIVLHEGDDDYEYPLLMANALRKVADIEDRSELLVYWDVLDYGIQAKLRTAGILSGRALDEIRRIFEVNMDGLEGCPECLKGLPCVDCAICEGEDDLDCAEIAVTDDLLVYIGPKVRVPEPKADVSYTGYLIDEYESISALALARVQTDAMQLGGSAMPAYDYTWTVIEDGELRHPTEEESKEFYNAIIGYCHDCGDGNVSAGDPVLFGCGHIAHVDCHLDQGMADCTYSSAVDAEIFEELTPRE